MTDAIGIDPGLRYSGLVHVRSNGPGLPSICSRTTLRDSELDPHEMAVLISVWVKTLLVAGEPVEAIGLEDFEHRSYLTRIDGSPRRVSNAAAMGKLVGEIRGRLSPLQVKLRIIPAGVSKAGYPSSQRQLARLLPRELRNSHERSAFLAASAALAMRDEPAPAHHPDVVPIRRSR